jgi:site-specific recombinase XerC
MSVEVIAQKLNQNGYTIAARSVQRVISEYGLQKKTASVSPHRQALRNSNP